MYEHEASARHNERHQSADSTHVTVLPPNHVTGGAKVQPLT